ncbi:Multisubunit Na+/H+ antiporter, MnhE subunit [Halalkaliarchaeum sp. AArc-CO]|uniref:monovalent cation/H+ antiporter subunit E n=1 Tax=unclassified Halalkaliarchaeum TaxID=2678344 RepID=UPI00217E791D|nr:MULTISPECIES: monovalent cation/H+ antiporter subunit E [unclassified Halalkaliarchaeum]MDR5673466.1 monovalent cation/H+ antiporter subunit E [Halalkaliarchaeum sp. AArc-GB]UWG49858.1 Multisubunit Na+/H+ antiporter, MnhE subunit [Halalkaliarchaeum sp. AArc-CO]
MPAERGRLLVPVKNTATVRKTVAHAVEQIAAADGEPELHFVYLATWRDDDPGSSGRYAEATDLLDRIEVWCRYDAEEAGYEGTITDETVHTAVLGHGEYLFGADDYAELLFEYTDEHGIETVLMDPEYSLVGRSTLHQPLDFELEARGLTVEEAPVERPSRRQRLARELSAGRFLFVFGVSYLFYLVLGGFSGLFDVVTGAVSAAIVAGVLSTITIDRDPSFPETPLRLLRLAVYVPYLFVEIVKSNLIIASVILRPSMPIKPRLTRVRVYVGPGVQLTTLANSITLTPGTLTVRARDQDLYVHSLVPSARDGLFAGSLERWVRFVFYGREAARIASPEERGDTEILQGPEADAVIEDGPPDADPDDDGSDEEREVNDE